MHIFCDYCGCKIDLNKDVKCPNCGATYKNNSEYIKYREDNLKIENQVKEMQSAIINHTLDAFKTSKTVSSVILIVTIILFIVIFIIFFITMFSH